ncbi:MAG: double-strand break repair protein AddB, partial [Rhizobiales bacterium]|nr:double-strand break repair protein AddB [Hyphomicrobiales bacterium]
RRGHGGIARLAATLAEARAEAESPEAKHVPAARKRLRSDEWGVAEHLARQVTTILEPLDAAFRAGGSIGAADAARLQNAALKAAATGPGETTTGLFEGAGGEALATLLDGIAEESRLTIAPAEWPALLATLMAGATLTRPAGADPRVHIWGTLEARLQSADLVILAGLDEKVWPSESRTDPWLSRTMRAEVGLPPPEQRLGQAAHDFATAFASPRVMLTRAEKRGGAPTVASRWLQRLFALAGPEAENQVRTRGAVHVERARELDRHAGNPVPMPRPAPKPPVERRPRSLSITEIEKLVRDPYEIYARHVLRLEPLDPLGLAPDYALKGTLIHDAIGRFGEEWTGPFDAAARDRLLALGAEALAEIADFPDTHALWRFRFEAMADWIVGWEAGRDATIAARSAEIRGRMELPAPAGPFALRGRADRIDLRHDGRIEVLDFKTGTPPSARQVLLGLAPQLALEAAMVRAGAFGEDFRDRSVARLFWVALNAVERGQPIKNAVEEGMTADAVADMALARLGALIAAFDDPGRGYVSRARPMDALREPLRPPCPGAGMGAGRERGGAVMVRSASTLTIDTATKKAQADASDPRASAWVSANAGSGKTHVLAYRVIRLLLAGADPGRILCLTFTRAAAAEMSKRVFDILAKWTAMTDTELRSAIAAIEQRRPSAEQLADARKLFARALETPGGLKIQTIHAFCERLLHQFPFEANVAGHFEVLDQRDAEALAEHARRTVLARADADGGVLGKALHDALGSASDFMVERAMKEFIDGRDRLRRWIAGYESLDAALLDLQASFGLDGDEDLDTLRSAIVAECPFADDFGTLVARLAESGSKKDLDAADRLAPVLTAGTSEAAASAYLAFWAKADGDLRVANSLVTNAVKKDWPGLAEMLEAERERLEALVERIRGAESFHATAAIVRLADRVVAEYERMKTTRGVLDFEDLVVKTVALLSRPDASAWVHYKLDRGLEHILVDEAQDTSPRQWQVVQALAEEFFAGEGMASGVRTLFAVGDEKQSIFSFQGAVPAWFSRMRETLGNRARRAGFAWKDPALHLSFRSVPVVLEAVDTVFLSPKAHRGLSTEPGPTTHTAARQAMPGRVIVWPMIEPPEKVEPADWASPVDHLGEKSPEVQLANRIADTVAGWLEREEQLESTGVPIRPGDILILSRMRGAQTDAINRALKTRGVPIAGADRIKLTEHIAVMDLIALGRVMLLPEDDLSLAALLKSPLIGLDEEQLYAVASGRGRISLWAALGVAAVDEGGAFAEARRRLDAWRAGADQVDPHAFYA